MKELKLAKKQQGGIRVAFLKEELAQVTQGLVPDAVPLFGSAPVIFFDDTPATTNPTGSHTYLIHY